VPKSKKSLGPADTVKQTRLRNDLYCVECDVKLYYTIPYKQIKEAADGF